MCPTTFHAPSVIFGAVQWAANLSFVTLAVAAAFLIARMRRLWMWRLRPTVRKALLLYAGGVLCVVTAIVLFLDVVIPWLNAINTWYIQQAAAVSAACPIAGIDAAASSARTLAYGIGIGAAACLLAGGAMISLGYRRADVGGAR